MDMVIMYSDGGAHNERGDMHGMGSYAFLTTVDLAQGYVDVYAKYEADTTNNRTEMLAILEGINFISQHSQPIPFIQVYSDSGYVVKGYNDPSYLEKWRFNGWKTSTKKPVINQDLWMRFIQIPLSIGFNLQLIRGHNKDRNPIHAFWNDICDKACTYAMNNLTSHNHLCNLRYYFNSKSFKFIGEVE